MKKFTKLLTISTLALSLIGCGSSSTLSTENSSSKNNTVTVESYSISDDGTTWEPIMATFDKVPERVLCNNQGAAELMLRLGLGDKIAGVSAVFGDPAEDVAEEFSKLNVLSTSYISKEVALSVNPDCIIGRGDLFINGDYGVGTVTDLNNAGISTYITHVGEDKATYDSFLADIKNLGKIFNVEDRAQELVEIYNNKINTLEETYGNNNLTMAEIATVENGVPTLSSPAKEYIQNEAFEMIGLKNAFADFTGSEISVETLIESNPDVLILFDYAGGPNMDEMIEGLYNNASLQDITAIKEKRVYALDFNEIYGGSGDIYDAMGKLAETIY